MFGRPFHPTQIIRRSRENVQIHNCSIPFRKAIELSPSGLPLRGSSFQKLNDFAAPFLEMQSSRVVPFASVAGRLRGAVFHYARSLRRAQNLLRCNLLNNLSYAIMMRLISETLQTRSKAWRLRGETVPTREEPTAQTPTLPFGLSDHLRRPRGALGLPPLIPRGSRTLRCGCADHHRAGVPAQPSDCWAMCRMSD
jgi:hypothetical protein